MTDSWTIDGKTHELEDFTLGELELLEDTCGDLDDPRVLRSLKFIVHLVWTVMRRDNAALTLYEVRAMKLDVLNQPEGQAEAANGVPPTKPKGKGARSTPAASGASS
jgi:hypothetical protein